MLEEDKRFLDQRKNLIIHSTASRKSILFALVPSQDDMGDPDESANAMGTLSLRNPPFYSKQ